MLRARCTGLFVTVIATLALAAPANAQFLDQSPPVMDWLGAHLQAQQWCNISWCRVDDDASSSPPTPAERARARQRARRQARLERIRERRTRRRARRQLKRNARRLAFVPRAGVSQRVLAETIEEFAPGDEPNAVTLRQQLEASPPFTQFSAALRKQTTWSPRNTADVYAFAFIQAWLTVSEARTLSSTVDNAVRADIRSSMARERAVWAASDPDQQEFSERIASWTVVLSGQHSFLRDLGDARPAEFPSPREFRREINERAQSRYAFGVDFSAIKLTRKGIVQR